MTTVTMREMVSEDTKTSGRASESSWSIPKAKRSKHDTVNCGLYLDEMMWDNKAKGDPRFSLVISSMDKLHELGTDGDTAMGSETNHLKRKAEKQGNQNGTFRPRKLLTKKSNDAVRK